MNRYDLEIFLCDPRNPSVGYQIRVVDTHDGASVLNTARDPATGEDLLTLADALRVAGYYTERSAHEGGAPQ